MGLKDYTKDSGNVSKGRFDKMVESGVDVFSLNKNTVEFNINALTEKPRERKKSFSFTLKPSLDKKLKALAEENGYSNKSSFISALIEALPDPKK